MKNHLLNLLQSFDNLDVHQADIISWGSPIISFGNLSSARIATLGLNPSNREFVDNTGNELNGNRRRFHTLNSLRLSDWSSVDESHIHSIIESCNDYFSRNPYDSWFKKLDKIISGTAMSYYFPSGQACHLDLIPFATFSKWATLTDKQKSYLLEISKNTLGYILSKSPIQMIVLNGQTVVDNFEKITNVKLDKRHMPEWELPRKIGDGVAGFAYTGFVESIENYNFERSVMILGYNHNIQSSFGVTAQVQNAIKDWITISSKELLHETR